MSLLIKDDCIACDACIEECPNEAIEDGDTIYTIDTELCTECIGVYSEPSCVTVCPVDCIVPDRDNIETLEELKIKYKKLNALEN